MAYHNKSKATDFFKTRYKKLEVIVSNFPGAWTPQSVILDGKFLIQTAPAPDFREYTDMLLKQFVQPHLRAGALEVHVLFDDPDNSCPSPKEKYFMIDFLNERMMIFYQKQETRFQSHLMQLIFHSAGVDYPFQVDL